MNKENTNKLYQDFAELYRGHVKTPEESCMCWGFDCDDGWFSLIYDLSQKISELNTKAEAFQVKQKFGELRFSLVESDDILGDVISAFEAKSKSICEVCGDNDSVVNQCGRHYIVLCKQCSVKGYKGVSCTDDYCN